jgi:hypothetical protein
MELFVILFYLEQVRFFVCVRGSVIFMGQRELRHDRLTSIDKCQAKGGPLNCRYHSGVLLDEVDALTGSKNTNMLVTAVRGNVFDDSDESFLVKMAQDKVEDTVTRLLDVYTIDNNKSKHFYYTDDNGKQHDYTDDDIIGIRHSLYHMQDFTRKVGIVFVRVKSCIFAAWHRD